MTVKIRSDWLNRLLGLGFSTLVQQWWSTLDYQVACYDNSADVGHRDFEGPVLYCIWHEYSPVPFYLRPYSRLSLLTSRHADAEFVAQSARYIGAEVIRGSTARGGATALRNLYDQGKRRNLAIAPDGPRGPRRCVAAGPIYLASKLQIPLTLVAPGYDRPWRLKTWDRFAIPRPGSRCRIILSPPIRIPPKINRHEMEDWRQRVETTYQHLTQLAEQWAENGGRYENQRPVSRQGCANCRMKPLAEPDAESIVTEDPGTPTSTADASRNVKCVA